MQKFSFFNQYNVGVLVLNSDFKAVFLNNVFKRMFGESIDIKRFMHSFNFDICMLDTQNLEAVSPIFQAVNSGENFTAVASFLSENSENNYYEISTIKKQNYTILFFNNVSGEYNYNILSENYKKLCAEHAKLLEENTSLSKTKTDAQSQAVKIALINKVSNIFSTSLDFQKILAPVLNEVLTMFGAFRVYYAVYEKGKFCPLKSAGSGFKYPKSVAFDENTVADIKKNKISVLNKLCEYEGCAPFKSPVLRTIVPIFHSNDLKGILVLLSRKQRNIEDENEILTAISAQFANAIVRTELHEKNLKTVEELKSALKELKETQIQLINSEKMASLGLLVAGVAHEINTPVASIKSNNALIAKIIRKLDDNEFSETLDEINKLDAEAINRINNIVVSLKRFVRLDEAELQEADINSEMDLTLDLIRHETKNRINIVKNYGNIPLVKCYPNMLNQVFTNILMNACQAIKETGTIEITTFVTDKNLVIKIKDDGEGIPKDKINKIFTVGFTTKGVGVGTGLGLAICSKIIEKHGGEITVNSEVGKGTCFTITIGR
ncbi:GHKL domain-containing protein [bacterium]|nr:GHKL domain-containing protein [bacterium]